MSLKKYTLFFM